MSLENPQIRDKRKWAKLHEYLQEMNRETFGEKNLDDCRRMLGADIENEVLFRSGRKDWI